MDFSSLTLTALFAVGAANVVMLFWPTADSRVKFFVSFLAALIAYFIPADLQSVFANAIKEAIAAAIIGSGIYKVAQKAGGN
jgi:hypothetical protein